eukprot:6196138-Pleurochrysis_carterae.AAC.1
MLRTGFRSRLFMPSSMRSRVQLGAGARPSAGAARAAALRRAASERLHVMPPVMRDEERVAGAEYHLVHQRLAQAWEGRAERTRGGARKRRECVQMHARSLIERVVHGERIQGLGVLRSNEEHSLVPCDLPSTRSRLADKR